MPDILIETKGAATANCYANQDEADDYHDNTYGNEEWADLGDEVKERLILTAAKQIDSFTMAFSKLANTQSMKFPVGKSGDDGFEQAKEANILQAYHLYAYGDSVNEGKAQGLQGVTSESISSIKTTLVGLNPLAGLDSQVLKLLSPYLDIGIKVRRG